MSRDRFGRGIIFEETAAMGREDRWEHGSDFHWFDARSAEPAGPVDWPWAENVALFGSGRMAARVLFGWGAQVHGWRRIWLPSFYCPDVPKALADLVAEGVLELRAYADTPEDKEPRIAEIRVGPGDVVVVANTFGIREQPSSQDAIARDAVIVDDHSHDLAAPWAMTSRAHYAFASLRKTLPLPDGGAVWSPRALTLPPEPATTGGHESATLDRLSGMVLKARYLAGHAIDKAAFLARLASGELHIGDAPPSGITPISRAMLPTLPIPAWRALRRANFETLLGALGPVRNGRVMTPISGAVAYALTLVFDTADEREAVRKALIAQRVYPAVLWPLDQPKVVGIPPDHIDLARRVLSIQCDQRYGSADMSRVAAILRPLVGA